MVKQLQNDIQYTEEQLKEKQREEEELNKQISDLINKTDSIGKYGGGTMFWPVPAVHNISSGFGYRWGRLHKGIDISRERFPFTDKMSWRRPTGVVIYANKTNSWGGGYGYYIIVDHGLDDQGRKISTLCP